MAKKIEMPPPPLPNVMKDILPLPGEKDKTGVANPKPEDVKTDPLVVQGPLVADPPPLVSVDPVPNPHGVNHAHHTPSPTPRKAKDWEPPKKR